MSAATIGRQPRAALRPPPHPQPVAPRGLPPPQPALPRVAACPPVRCGSGTNQAEAGGHVTARTHRKERDPKVRNPVLESHKNPSETAHLQKSLTTPLGNHNPIQELLPKDNHSPLESNPVQKNNKDQFRIHLDV
ncbi:hypothetical protein Fmac_021443 [Flemingia macrophylla]|uniref:Uncharacterized protein n=1 Tax=Flemingia macrophylla TaxID=520843 RepID=A0ABD1LWV8_9FABA